MLRLLWQSHHRQQTLRLTQCRIKERVCLCTSTGGAGARLVAKCLKDLALASRSGGVDEIALRASPELVCNNLMCEQIGGACVCKLERFMDSMDHVQSIDVGANALTVLPDSLWTRRTLEELDASDNRLTALSPQVAQLGDSLRVLRLAGNDLCGLPNELAQLEQLRELDVRRNTALTAADVQLLRDLARLRPGLAVLADSSLGALSAV